VFPALEKKFDINSSKEFVDQENITTKDISNSKLLIEALEEQVSNYMNQMEQIKIEKENIKNKKQASFSSVENRGELIAEKNRLINEHEMLRVTIDDYNNRLEKLDKIITDIDSELAWALDRSGSEEDTSFLKDKRIVFEHDRTSLEKTKQDILKLIKTSEISIDTIDKEIKSGEKLTEDDLIDMDNQIKLLDNKQDSLYAELLRDDSKLKSLKSQSLNKQLKIEQAQTYADMTIQTIENGSIINHLSTPLQPISVTTVSNYLRYYFCYHVTLLANELINKNPNENIYIIQALASKLILLDLFDVTLNTVFSVFPILEHDKIKNTLIITKE
jgi:chromosome segregation ATPase